MANRNAIVGSGRRRVKAPKSAYAAATDLRGATVAARSLVAEAEEADAFVHGPGLLIERSGRGRVLFNHRGVLIGHRIHLGERLVDLLEPAGLLGAGRGDVRHDVGHRLDRGDDIEERGPRRVDQPTPSWTWPALWAMSCLMSLAACADRWARPAHLRRHDREAPPRFARAGGLDRRIEREQIGLPSNLVDHADDVANLSTP